MMNSIVNENLVSFKVLEQEVCVKELFQSFQNYGN